MLGLIEYEAKIKPTLMLIHWSDGAMIIAFRR